MIQATTETAFTIYVQTEDNRIDTSVASTQIRHLVKFTNDLDKSVQYAYGSVETIYDRYTSIGMTYNINPDIYVGKTKLFPAGYWKYEVYEVSWIGTVRVTSGHAPATEDDVLLPAADDKGVVQGLVTKGKMNLSEKDGTEQVQYTQRQAPTATNYIYYGQDTSSWTPASEGSNLSAWYKNKEGITLNGSDVSAWSDSSDNSFDMLQATASEQPAYTAATGALTFDASSTQSLQTVSDIILAGTFTIGIRLHPAANNVIVLGDNTTTNEFFKISNSTQLRFKTDGSQVDITVNDGDLLSDNYLVITRDGSNLVSLYVNGTLQTDTETLAGTAEIDAIGVRATDTNAYDGIIREVQIYDTTSAELTANINTYLSTL